MKQLKLYSKIKINNIYKLKKKLSSNFLDKLLNLLIIEFMFCGSS